MNYLTAKLILISMLVSGCTPSSMMSNSPGIMNSSNALKYELEFNQGHFTESTTENILKIRSREPAAKKLTFKISYSGDFSKSDFNSLPESVTILKGSSEADLAVEVQDDSVSEPHKKINVKLELLNEDDSTVNFESENEYLLFDNDRVSVVVDQYENEFVSENLTESIRIKFQINSGGLGTTPGEPIPFDFGMLPPGIKPPLGFDLKLKLVKIQGSLSTADFVEDIDEIIFPGDSSEATLSFTARPDGISEGYEFATFHYKIVNAYSGQASTGRDPKPPVAGVTESDVFFVLKVMDADQDTVYLELNKSANCYSVREADTPKCILKLVRSGNLNKELNVQLDYSEGLAMLGTDFTAPSEVGFAAGQKDQTFEIQFVDDSLFELMENAVVKIKAGQNGISCNCDDSVSFPIFDNDSSPEGRSVEVKGFANLLASQVVLDLSTELNFTSYQIFRREFGDRDWGQVRATLPAGQMIFADSQVESGKTYEYRIERATGVGFVTVAYDVSAYHFKGRVLILAESTAAAALDAELSAWKDQIASEGWNVLFESVSNLESVSQIKERIIRRYGESLGLKAVVIFGNLAVPYSGYFAPDAHPDHVGAWPADVYYGDVDSHLWTDEVVNTTAASRPQNRNVPGDGKFDQSSIPSDIEIAIGRIDLSELPAFAPMTEIDLLRRYLIKMTNYRTGQFIPVRRALIDDHFGDFHGESFASSAWNSFGNIVGREAVHAKDWMTELPTNSYLWAYGCGGGTYTTASGIGSTTDFVNLPTKAVFTMIFGSYFGDWDSTDNFLRAPLAGEGDSLISVWSGRPKWSFHPMVSGISMDQIVLQNWNIPVHQSGVGSKGIHLALMGDPTLRDRVFPGVQSLSATYSAGAVSATWQDSDSSDGYHVYVSKDRFSGYRLVNSVATTSKTHTFTAGSDELFIMVRSVKVNDDIGGVFKNLSAGKIAEVK